MATASSSLPEEQQPQDQGAVPSQGWHSSGSIGPFFAVLSVLIVLTFLSCIAGRIYSKRAEAASPLESINDHRGCCGWLMRRFGRCTGGSGLILVAHKSNSAKAQQIDV